jgi:hypothetical protein
MADKSCFNTCNLNIETTNCNPGNRELWFKNKLPLDLDPVRSNIVNGCWECNYYDEDRINSTLCGRSFYNGYIENPCERVRNVNINSKLKHLGEPLHKNCILRK